MKKANMIVNIISFFVAIASFFSGVVLWNVLPSSEGFRGGRGEAVNNLFFGFDRHSWVDIHNVSSLIFIGLIIIHLILHWYWIKNLPKFIKG
jgi:hypothetical protein